MVGIIYKNVKRVMISLRFSIVSIFVTLFSIGILLLVSINYFQSSRTLVITAEKLMHEVSYSLKKDFSYELATAEKDDALSAELIYHKLLDVNSEKELIDYTYDLAYRFNLVQAAFWADEKGNYVTAEYEPDDSLTTIIINRNLTPATLTTINRSVKGDVIKKTSSQVVDYDPRGRPWYIASKLQKKQIWTDVFTYGLSRYQGVSVASPVYHSDGRLQGVFGLKIRLDWLSWYVGERKVSKNGVVFIVTDKGKLIAYPKLEEQQKPTKPGQEVFLFDIHDTKEKWAAESFDRYKLSGKGEFSFESKGETYLAVYSNLPNIAKQDWLIGIVAPKKDFIGELKRITWINTGLGILILIIGVLLILSIVTRLVRPIMQAVQQMNKIKQFDLSEQPPIHSRIEEVILLSSALVAVRAGLKSFKKYVPASLVRKLIKAGEDARIGGTKKTLTIFFSDIENFTQLAEKVEPNAFMEHVCEYFSEISKIISHERGTIDKYIGDSVMAFWGAPLSVARPHARAARAALAVDHRLATLNKKWLKEKKAVFKTRIGLHTGEVIVGNVGSTQRLNYTAIGDAINVASRLEGINKIYGTKIAVSDTLYRHLKDQFVFRKVDCVALKGKTISAQIYELLAEHKETLDFDIDQYNALFTQGYDLYQAQQWDNAITLFQASLSLYPEDTLTPVFIERCQNFKIHPPAASWDGIWKMTG